MAEGRLLLWRPGLLGVATLTEGVTKLLVRAYSNFID